MDFPNDNSTIISAELEQGDLVSPFDLSGGWEPDRFEGIVEEIILTKLENPKKAAESLNRYIDEFVWEYEFPDETDIFPVCLDNSDVVEIECLGINKGTADLTFAELLHKYQLLSDENQQESKDSGTACGNYKKLGDPLTIELNKEPGNLGKVAFLLKDGIKKRRKSRYGNQIL